MLRIRRATPADAGAIISGINAICAEGGAFCSSHFEPSPTWQTVLYRPEMAPDHILAVAEWDGAFAGAGRLFPEPPHSYLRHVVELGMFVLPPFRRRGIGRALLQWMLAWAGEHAYEKVTLAVFADNVPAITLYQSAGFAEEGRLRRQIKIANTYTDLVLMACWLTT